MAAARKPYRASTVEDAQHIVDQAEQLLHVLECFGDDMAEDETNLTTALDEVLTGTLSLIVRLFDEGVLDREWVWGSLLDHPTAGRSRQAIKQLLAEWPRSRRR